MKTIIITGGGSGGHISPIRAVVPILKRQYSLIWIGSSHFEKNAANNLGIQFKEICSGKIRRNLTIKNIIKNIFDMFCVKCGAWQSLFFFIKNRPEKVFSTGGFVSVPVVVVAWFLRIPIIIHEQTIGFGMANKIGAFCASKILLTFEDSKKYIPQKYYNKVEVVGNPIREDLLNGSFKQLQDSLGEMLDTQKRILYITGGGQGSSLINEIIFELLPELTKKYYIIHQTGKSGIKKARSYIFDDYYSFEFINNELANIYASADIVVARAGAGTVNELDYFEIPTIFIPLRPTQNDEQTKNAEWFIKRNEGKIIHQKELTKEKLVRELFSLIERENKENRKENNSTQKILKNLI